MIEPIKAAWMAGFLDGEGYIGISRNFNKQRSRCYYRVEVSIGQSVREPIQMFSECFGGNIVFQKNSTRNFWYLRIYGEQAYAMLQCLLPYLVVKRKQAELTLEYGAIETPRDGKSRFRHIPDAVYERRRSIWAAVCELNGGRALQAERLSEETPQTEGGAIVRSDGKYNRQSRPEMADRSNLN